MANVLPLPAHESPLLRLYRASISAPVCRLPLLLHRIPAGFPFPADECMASTLDLNTYLVRNKTASFFQVIDDSMTEANIHDDGLLVRNCSDYLE